jgi:hypothetical protein
MTLADFRDLSIILLAIEAVVVGSVAAVLVVLMIMGVMRLNREIPVVSPVVQGYFRKAELYAKVAGERIAAPFITAGATTARIKYWPRSLVSTSRKKNEV